MASTTKRMTTVAVVAVLALIGLIAMRVSKRSRDDAPRATPVASKPSPRGLSERVRGTASIAGCVRDQRQAPVSGARVCAQDYSYELVSRTHRMTHCAISDASGAYTIAGLVAAEYDIAASARGKRPAAYEPKRIPVASDERRSEIDLVLMDGGVELRGNVVDLTGGPIAGAVVRAGPRNTYNTYAATAETDAAGLFSLWVAPGEVWVSADADGYVGDTGYGMAGIAIELVLTPASSISGTVIDAATSAPVSGIAVQVGMDSYGPPADITAFVVAARERDGKSAVEESRRNEWNLRVVTDHAGHFKLTGLAVGDYTVRAMRRGGGEAFAEHVRTGDSVRLQIKQTGSIEGTVRSTSVPLHDLRVYCEQVGTGLARDERFFHKAGSYVLRDLPAGEYIVVASIRGRRVRARVTLADGERRLGVDLDLETGTTLTGRMVDLRTRQPLAGIRVGVISRELRFDNDMVMERITTDATGTFAFHWIPHGLVELRASSDGDLAATHWLREITGPNTNLGDVAMAKRGVDDDKRGTVGITLREYDSDVPSDQRRLEVASVAPPASGILVPGDVITSVNGIDVTGTNRVAGYNLFAVAPGTSLRLGLARGEVVTLTATRR